MRLSTFSIVAYDAQAREWGVATQSKFLAVGSVVPWAQAGAGAVATQSYANTSFGPKGLGMMAAGLSAQETLDRLLAEDDGRQHRQVGILDAQGNAATFTGEACYAWAGGLTGRHFAVQGNILVSDATVSAMAAAYEKSRGELVDRLIASLAAGQKAGGDSRGQQSTAVLVVRDKGGYAGFNDRYLDLRVDDHPAPIDRLQEIVELHHLYFKRPDAASLIPIDAKVTRELQRIVKQTRHYGGSITGEYDEATKRAVEALVGRENLEERWQPDLKIDPVVLSFLQKAYPARKLRAARGRPAPKHTARHTASRTARRR